MDWLDGILRDALAKFETIILKTNIVKYKIKFTAVEPCKQCYYS